METKSKESEKENPRKSKSKGGEKTIIKEGSDSESSEESLEEFEVVEIHSKTQTEETEFLKETFNKLIKEKEVKDGKSLEGTSVQTISDSIPFTYVEGASITIKLTNFLDSALTDPQYYFWNGLKVSEPLDVLGNFSEVFSFRVNGNYCFTLCSFAISRVLRLVIVSYSGCKGDIRLGIGFIPADVSTDKTLDASLWEMRPAPDGWFLTEWRKVPLEHFVTHGNLLMRGHMTNGPRSIVHVEILEFNPMVGYLRSVIGGNQRIVDGNTFELIRSTNNAQTISKSVRIIERFSCIVETVNCLSVPLRTWKNRWYSNSENNTFLPMEVLPMHRETYFASDQTNLKVMFTYEIISTDLTLVIGLKMGPGGNSFAVSFVRFPVVTGKKILEKFMDENEWKTHDYKTISKASEGMQLISIRNIRAEILMTEEEKSDLKIRVFAV